MRSFDKSFSTGLATVLLIAAGAQADPSYKLMYWYEVDGSTNQSCPITGGGCGCSGTGNHSVYAHVQDHNGLALGNKRLEDSDNPGKFGITNNDPNDKLGFTEIPLFINDNVTLTVNDSALASDVTPPMIENRAPTFGHYSWECGFMYVPNGVNVTFDTTLIGTPNKTGGGCDLDAPFTKSCAFYDIDPFNWASGSHGLDTSAGIYGQTFIANGNRVVAAKFQTTIGALANLKYAVVIRKGGPGGEAAGPAGISRFIKSDEFFTQNVRWPLLGAGAVEVEPGQTYIAEIVRADSQGSINIWRRNGNVYPDGQMFRNGVAVPGMDLLGRVVCATVIDDPVIKTSTSVIQPVSSSCDTLLHETFTVRNDGPDTLIYSVSENQPWLFTLPISGSSTGEDDTINVYINTAGLAAGQHNATITVSSNDALNSPQTVDVQLNIATRTTPGDLDGDCDVDQSDFGMFQRCVTGPTGLQETPSCLAARLDSDTDVDLEDFGIFQACMTGPDQPGNPDCAN